MDTLHKFETLANKATDDVITKVEAVERSVNSWVNKLIDHGKAYGLSEAQIIKSIRAFFFEPVSSQAPSALAPASISSYCSGLKRAMHHKVQWFPGINNKPEYALPETAKKKGGRKVKAATKAVTVGSVKVDRKARTIEVKLGTSTDIGMFTEAVTAIQSEPARVTLFLNYCKAQGWIKAE